MLCPGCKVEIKPTGTVHASGCKVFKAKQDAKELERIVKRIRHDPDAMREFLNESISRHLVKLHQLAMAGSHRAAQQFREGALDVIEMLAKDEAAERRKQDGEEASKRGRKARGMARQVDVRDERGAAAGGETPADPPVGEPPVGVADGD